MRYRWKVPWLTVALVGMSGRNRVRCVVSFGVVAVEMVGKENNAEDLGDVQYMMTS